MRNRKNYFIPKFISTVVRYLYSIVFNHDFCIVSISLWFKFKKWGDVREIFITKNRNRSGRRYDFVRFKRVEDVQKLER